MLAVDDWHSSPTSSEYIDFKFTTKPGMMFHLDNIAFDHTRSSNGPTGYKVKVDGAEVGTGAVTNSCGHASISVNLNYGGSTTVTVRIIGTGASDDHGDPRGRVRLLEGMGYALAQVGDLGLQRGGAHRPVAVEQGVQLVEAHPAPHGEDGEDLELAQREVERLAPQRRRWLAEDPQLERRDRRARRVRRRGPSSAGCVRCRRRRLL